MVLNEKWAGKDTFTVDEAAEILRLSRASTYKAVNDKEIAAIRFGRRFVIPRIALERLLAPAV